MEFAKYYNVTSFFIKMEKEQPNVFMEANVYTRMYICYDTNDFWIARVQKDLNEDYEKEEGTYLLEREKISICDFAQYVIDHGMISKFEINKVSVHDLIKYAPLENIIETLLIMDNERGYENFDCSDYSSIESLENDLDGGYGIVKYHQSSHNFNGTFYMKKSKILKSTWCDRKGEMYNIHLTPNEYGKRISVMKWIDSNDVEIRLIIGDGRTIYFKEYKSAKLSNPTNEEIEKIIQEFIKIDKSTIKK